MVGIGYAGERDGGLERTYCGDGADAETRGRMKKMRPTGSSILWGMKGG